MSRALHIAVANGDPALCQFYQETLPRLGHEVRVAHAGRQLVDQCRLVRPDLVITEVGVAHPDGIAVIKELCRDQPVPIIVLTESHDGDIQGVADLPYVLGCLIKPVKDADLVIAITLAMARFEQLQTLRQEATDLRLALEDRKLIERAKGLIMRYVGLEEDEAFLRMRRLASDHNRKLIQVAQSIVAAGDVFHQLERHEKGCDSPPPRLKGNRPNRTIASGVATGGADHAV